jgi:hypothetical protein
VTLLKRSSAPFLVVSLVAVTAPAGFADQADEPAATAPVGAEQQTPEPLRQMVAPTALYPDALLAQILAGATDPDQIVEADRWIEQHPDLAAE